MSCNKCKDPCGKDSCRPKVCGCSTMVDAKCVIYSSCDYLDGLGIGKGNTAEEALKRINALIQQLQNDVDNAFVGTNVGLGKEIYAGQSVEGVEQFKTLFEGNGIGIKEAQNDLTFYVKEDFINRLINQYNTTRQFEEDVHNAISDDWFHSKLFKDLSKDWFRSYFETLLTKSSETLKPLVEQVVRETSYEEWFKDLIGDTITEKIKNSSIDICSLIGKCNIKRVDEDNSPYANSRSITLSNKENKSLSKSDLSYSDPDGDEITNVKFEGDVSNLYIDSSFSTRYVQGTELPINFKLYFKAPISDSSSEVNLNYTVKSKNKYSNMATLKIINKAKVLTFSDCVKLSTSQSFTADDVLRGKTYSNVDSGKTISVSNNCNKEFTIPRTVLLTDTENGGTFEAYINQTTIPANQTKNIPVIYNGVIKNTNNTVTHDISFNGSTSRVTLTVANEDRPPIANDRTIELENGVDKVITKSDLSYSDPDGDEITNVKFEGDVSTVYTDSAHNTPYVSGTELPISFKLYHKAEDTDPETIHTLSYKVKANGKWSN